MVLAFRSRDHGMVVAEMCETHAPELAVMLQARGWDDGVVVGYGEFLELAPQLGFAVDPAGDDYGTPSVSLTELLAA